MIIQDLCFVEAFDGSDLEGAAAFTGGDGSVATTGRSFGGALLNGVSFSGRPTGSSSGVASTGGVFNGVSGGAARGIFSIFAI